MSQRNSPRDTKFQGFAKLLADELYDALDTIDALDDPCAPLWMLWSSVVEPIIARRAHSLVKHTIDSIAAMDYGGGPINISAINAIFETEDIPDMATWPEEEEQ